MTLITEPGLYTGIPSAAYHADPCPSPSLSSTGARTLADECPAQYWHDRSHPKRKREFDIGNASHLMILEPEIFPTWIAAIDADDFKTKAAQEARDAAYAADLIPLTRKDLDLVQAMRTALWRDPIAQFAFTGGKSEQSLFWRHAEFGNWCRSRLDYLPPHMRYLCDFKTSTTANPAAFSRAMWEYGYYAQAAWYLDSVEAIFGERPERFAFVVQSKSPPHLVTTHWLTEEDLEWGRIQNRYAAGVFAWCLERGEWPSYRPDLAADGAFVTPLPGFARNELQKRMDRGDFTPPQEMTGEIA